RVQNAGPDDIFGLRVVDTLPAELEAASWTCQATTPVPGDLEPVDQVGAANTAGGALVVSADGRHAYQVATGTASLYAYDRNNVPGNGFGNVASLETETEGNNDISDPGAAVSGMHAPIAIAM